MGSLYISATPSALSGAARLLDFGNTFDSYNLAGNGAEADALGIFWDWVMVGDSLWDAFSDERLLTELAQRQSNAEVEFAGR